MTDISQRVTVSLLLHMMREAVHGPPGPWTYFSDRGPGTGLLGTIDGLSPEAASRQDGGARTTIAGHVHHVCASLALATRTTRGEPASRDRSASWTVSAVDDAAWSALRARLRCEYEAIVMAIEARGEWDEESLGAVIGAVAHTAYHLGAIRQRLASVGSLA
jgi:hypothetical protein